MPMYEYACRRCEKRFEARLSYEQRLAPQQCPACGAMETSLCLSVPGRVGATSPKSAAAGGCGAENGACGCGRYPAPA